MLESIGLLTMIISGVLAGYYLNGHNWISRIFVFILFLIVSLQTIWFLTEFSANYLNIRGSISTIVLSLFVFFLLGFIFYRISIFISSKIKVDQIDFIQKMVSSIFFAIMFTLFYAFLLRFMAGSGMISQEYINESLPIKIILSFCQLGDHLFYLTQNIFDKISGLAEEIFDSPSL
jgi:hypothetical protein